MSAAPASLQLTRVLESTGGLPRSVRLVGRQLARRLRLAELRQGPGAFGGSLSLQEAVQRDAGILLDERTVQLATAFLRRWGYLEVRCCGGRCRGGRGHAATYRIGWRVLAARRVLGHVTRGVFSLRKKYGPGFVAGRFLTKAPPQREPKGAPLARLTRRRGGAAPPLRRPAAAATPERVDDGVGPERLSSLFDRLS